mmetsp:Transcript_87613/g.225721  ORF Transcript_87613/g.225721 Transcript_87613/m.225721 type:complete len:252 (+) Transcript_87613:582-1337(+)
MVLPRRGGTCAAEVLKVHCALRFVIASSMAKGQFSQLGHVIERPAEVCGAAGGCRISEGRRQEVVNPTLRQSLVLQGSAVVRIVCWRLPPLRPAVEEGTQLLSRAGLNTEIAADHRPEVLRVVELLLGAMRVRTTQAQGAALRVGGPRVLLAPVGAWLRAVANGRLPPRILVGVSVDAGLPVVLRADRAPESLELPCEETLGERSRCVLLFLFREEGRHDLIARVSKCATRTPAAGAYVGEEGAEALLLVT